MTAALGSSQGLLGVRRFIIERDVLRETIEFLQEVGSTGYEGFVVWAGNAEDEVTFRFRTALIPQQKAMMMDSGLLVLVDGEALFAINKKAHELGQTLGAQVHSHPTSAYHSSTDDFYPLVTLLGALSIVLPDFAQNAPDDISVWAWYRLAEYGVWEPMGSDTQVIVK